MVMDVIPNVMENPTLSLTQSQPSSPPWLTPPRWEEKKKHKQWQFIMMLTENWLQKWWKIYISKESLELDREAQKKPMVKEQVEEENKEVGK